MCSQNQSGILQLRLQGFGKLFYMETALFILIFQMYAAALVGNILIILTVLESPKLHSPMYFFLSNLSLCEIMFTTVVTPTILQVLWSSGGTVTLYQCITQFYFYASTGAVEILLLNTMAFDRYQAICNPLRYSLTMGSKTQRFLVCLDWVAGFIVMSISTTAICSLEFCGSSKIDHVFCDLEPIIELSSTETFVVRTIALVITILFCFLPFMLIIASYISIFFTILRISSRTGRLKTFSTCSSHLASVFLYFGSLFIIYLVPSQGNSKKLKKFLSLSFIVLTPMLNPVIYTLRNQDIKTSLKVYMCYLEQKYLVHRNFSNRH
ncbi:olfactory receptor 10A2-like [Engystomops pustulosus]|uniref:olfactory receptor 10A2-like n=1 Tax=Engystomops pustulosus TaxID=76066 RepID=UPI003AFA15EB